MRLSLARTASGLRGPATLVLVSVLVPGVSPSEPALPVGKTRGAGLRAGSPRLCLLPAVPSDVFFVGSVWQGHYEYLGKGQPATLTVDCFNATGSKVNATFRAAAQVELKLTGRPGLS